MTTNQPKPKTPYHPVPYREGNDIIRLFDIDYCDPIGNKAIITKADYTDKKGKLIENYTLFIKWK